jgi:uncharacterized protein
MCYNEVGDYMDIIKIQEFVKSKLQHEPSGHDYLHAMRVYNNAILLMDDEVKREVVLISCLIHDLIDHKLEEKYKANNEEIISVLEKADMNQEDIQQVFDIINNISYSKGNIPSSIEGKIVQDADRLDALGAIGIARTFSFGGKNNRLIYSEDTVDGEDSVSHFYQKLFKLKDLMNTEKGYKEAVKRTGYMKEFMKKFYEEVGVDNEV